MILETKRLILRGWRDEDAPSLFNYAKEVKGAQFGVINYAETSDGIAIGVINIIKDGMHHIGFNWDTNDMFDMFFQSGTKHLFITLGTAMDRDDFFKKNRDTEHSTCIFKMRLNKPKKDCQ